MDNIEKLILENRERLDQLDPSSGVWNKIKRGHRSRGFRMPRLILLKVAAIVFVFAVSWLTFDAFHQPSKMEISGFTLANPDGDLVDLASIDKKINKNTTGRCELVSPRVRSPCL